MQLRFQTSLTSEQYVIREAWREASLECCPLHGEGCNGLRRHGSYGRVEPAGIRVARWRCVKAGVTFSLLPDFLSARLRGDLDSAEAACVTVESLGVEPAARDLRPEVGLPSVMRWLRRRTKGVRAALLALVTTMPEMVGSVAEVSAVRESLSTTRALVALRGIGATRLHALPSPLGFAPRRASQKSVSRAPQHKTGPAPPTVSTL